MRSHIAICIPCLDKPHMEFSASMAHLMYHAGRGAVPLATIFQSSSIITFARNKCIEQVVAFEKAGTEFSHILFLDSDMVFPQDTLFRLLTHAKPIVGCTYVQRTAPYNLHGKTLEGKAQDISAKDLIEVAGLPTGCLLIHRDVFRRLKRPYFRLVDSEESSIGAGDHLSYGEDYVFCAMARAAGFKIYLDVQLSKEIGHIAQKTLFPDQPAFPLNAGEEDTLEGLQTQMLGIQKQILEKMKERRAA